MKSALFLLVTLAFASVTVQAQDCQLHTSAEQIRYGSKTLVYVGDSQRPVMGEQQDQHFTPNFSLSPDLKYRVEAQDCETQFFSLEDTQAQTIPAVTSIWPQADTLPENILRFYIRFSEPMREGDFLKYIRLTHIDSGEDLSGVFFDNQYELWSPDYKQITLLVDPGRVKTGLHTNKTQGRAFKAGERYRLSILPQWQSIRGQQLQAGYNKEFIAGKEHMQGMQEDKWHIQTATANSQQAIVIKFDTAVDHMSVNHYLGIVDAQQQPIPGTWNITNDNMSATFTPNQPWDAGQYQLIANARFEDVVGNNINGAFDHKQGELRSQKEGFWVKRTFTIQ